MYLTKKTRSGLRGAQRIVLGSPVAAVPRAGDCAPRARRLHDSAASGAGRIEGIGVGGDLGSIDRGGHRQQGGDAFDCFGATGATGLAAGALTAGIGAGVAVLVGVLASLWSAHEARIKGATQENQAINSAVQTFDAGLKAIFAAANSTAVGTNITAAQAAQYSQQLLQQFFAQMAPFTHAAGAADASNGGANCGSTSLNPGGPCTGTPGGHVCNAQCTATCCVGCQDLYPTILQALQVFASPTGGTITACTVYSSKYGAAQRGSYTLTYTPPAASSAAGVINSLTSSSPAALSSLATTVETSTVAGIPLWMLLAGGVGLFLAFR